jgi:hypothetical protein
MSRWRRSEQGSLLKWKDEMKKLFVVSVIFFIIGVGCLSVALYLFGTPRYEKPAAETRVSKGAEEEKTVVFTEYKKPETVDRSTPDKAIQSYWEYLDYVTSAKREPEIKRYRNRQREFDKYQDDVVPIEQPFLELFFSGEPLQARLKDLQEPGLLDLWFDPRDRIQMKYRRVIREVRFESDTRAKVNCTIYNVTPLDNLKQPLTQEEKQKRERGRDFVYTMEKFKDGWKIIARTGMCSCCLGTRYNKGELCSCCKGTGWEKLDALYQPSENLEIHTWYYDVHSWEN